MKFVICIAALLLTAWTLPTRAADAPPSPQDLEFFEKNVRPVLAQHCYSCHSAQAKKVKGKLLLDSREGVAKGGESGPALAGRDPDQSRLIQAIRWTDPDLQMPPKEKLPAQQIAALEQWIRMGAPDPREASAGATTTAAGKGMTVEQGRKWWAFQPVNVLPAPATAPSGAHSRGSRSRSVDCAAFRARSTTHHLPASWCATSVVGSFLAQVIQTPLTTTHCLFHVLLHHGDGNPQPIRNLAM